MRKYIHLNQCTRPVSGMYDVSVRSNIILDERWGKSDAIFSFGQHTGHKLPKHQETPRCKFVSDIAKEIHIQHCQVKGLVVPWSFCKTWNDITDELARKLHGQIALVLTDHLVRPFISEGDTRAKVVHCELVFRMY